MQRAGEIARSGTWPAEAETGTVTLAFDDRHRRRLVLETDAGRPFLLDLERPERLDEGDGLVLDDGGVVRVVAAAEALIEVRAKNPHDLLRYAWHLGNRHLPAQIEAERILIRADHVIADMLRGLGAEIRDLDAPFTPEGGAYDARTAAHGHQDDHAHDHEHGHGHHHHDHHHHGHHHHGHGHSHE